MWHHKGHSGKINNSFRYLLGLEGRALMDSCLSGFLQLSIRGHSVHSTEALACVCTHTPIFHLPSSSVQKYCSSNPLLWTQWELNPFRNVDLCIKINFGGEKVPCAQQADSFFSLETHWWTLPGIWWCPSGNCQTKCFRGKKEGLRL